MHVHILESKVYCGPDKFYGRSKFGQCDKEKDHAPFISSGFKIVKRIRRRQYDQAIIERAIGLVIGPLTAPALYRSFLNPFTTTTVKLTVSVVLYTPIIWRHFIFVYIIISLKVQAVRSYDSENNFSRIQSF